MLPPTAGIAQEQRDRPDMAAFQQRRDVRELTREIIRDARVANRQQSTSPGGKQAGQNDATFPPWHVNLT